MKKQGFSLVELMISLIVISIITAAFAPVVTKKLKASGAAYIASGGSASTTCTAIQPDGTCKLCTKNTPDGLCLLCEATCTKGQYLEYDKCTCHTCADTNCELCSGNGECYKCKKGYDLFKGSCVETCGDKDLLRVKSGGVNICVTKYNMGDKRKFPIPDTVKMIRAGDSTQSYVGNGSVPICWYGITSDKDKCNSSNGHYSGCGRTVCNWRAAREICSKFSLNGVAWRLPTLDEAMAFSGYSENLKEEGLGLCARYDNGGVAFCYSSSQCYGSTSNVCWPGYLWTDTQQNDSVINDVFQTSVGVYRSSSSYYSANSVRCVQGGYPDISKQCTITDWQCVKCSSDGTTCIKCEDGYALESDNLCWMTCPSGQYAKIRAGFESTRHQECANCPDPNCATCKGGTPCTACKSGYILQNGTCKINCGTNMYFDASVNACKYCPSGHHYCDGTNLDPCASNQGFGSTATANKALCTSCGSSYGQCKECKNGFLYQYRASYFCNDCPDNCTTCVDRDGTGAGRCTVCNSGYDLTYDGYCVKNCSYYDGGTAGACLSCSDAYEQGCLSCASGYGLAQMDGLVNKGNNWRVCKKCPDHCARCDASYFYSYSVGDCTQCESGYKLAGSSGEAYCTPAFDCSALGFGAKCLECNSSQCTRCEEGYYWDANYHTCSRSGG